MTQASNAFVLSATEQSGWRLYKSHRSATLLTLLAGHVLLGFSSVVCAEPSFVSRNIFPPGNKHAHSSSIVECPDGSLLACWFYGSGERKAADVVVQGSRLLKGSDQWSAVFPMADTPEFPDCNPVLFIDGKERLWMFWITVLAERWECSQLKYRRATDATGSGAPDWNWQGIVQLKPGDRFATVMGAKFDELQIDESMWSEYAKPYSRMLLEAATDPLQRQTGWMSRTHPITLPSGRILLPLYSDGFNASLVAISDDLGETWRASEPMIGLGPIQPSVVRKSDGTLVAFCRDSGSAPQRVLRSISRDNGETWSAAVDTEIPNPGSSLEVISLAGGDWLMVANDTEQDRDQLTAMLSTDEGETWKFKRAIEPSGATGSFDYPSVIQSRDGTIHVTYSHSTDQGRCIRHAQFHKDWIVSE